MKYPAYLPVCSPRTSLVHTGLKRSNRAVVCTAAKAFVLVHRCHSLQDTHTNHITVCATHEKANHNIMMKLSLL